MFRDPVCFVCGMESDGGTDMTMRERIRDGKLFTDDCEGLPKERQEAKKRMMAFNGTTPEQSALRVELMKEMLADFP